MDNPNVELRVGAHVLVQLGSELVTDVEQAILECVKNSYDADSAGCRIEIDTREVGVQVEMGLASKLKRFTVSSETVEVIRCNPRRPRFVPLAWSIHFRWQPIPA